jgi:two-component system, chemotaxis family, sensor kinase Cph1
LNVILDQALQNLQVSLKDTGAKVEHEPMPVVPADASQIRQVFQNLIGNALKFRGDRVPEIFVRAKMQENQWKISVQDNGIGIQAQFNRRIFQIFQRLHTRKQYPGTGIGLAICKKVVERHGGNIWVESEPGKGATFHFTLPLSQPVSADSEVPP